MGEVLTPYYQDDAVTIYHGDCRDVLPSIPLPVELCLATDPPYGIGGARHGSQSDTRDNPRRWTNWLDEERCPEGLAFALSMCGPAAVWGGNFYTDILPPSAGWLVWVKPEADTGFSLADAELCWTNRTMATRVRKAARSLGRPAIHPTRKPTTIMTWTLGFVPGDTILDPFMGTGTTLKAAKALGRKAIGIEIEERYCEIAAKRCAQEVLALEAR
jgi:site-specific DNA-methyltransferase (adenine-specific)